METTRVGSWEPMDFRDSEAVGPCVYEEARGKTSKRAPAGASSQAWHVVPKEMKRLDRAQERQQGNL